MMHEKSQPPLHGLKRIQHPAWSKQNFTLLRNCSYPLPPPSVLNGHSINKQKSKSNSVKLCAAIKYFQGQNIIMKFI